jgi:hypothetical protein
MAVTMQNVVDRARDTLNDDDKVRWDDAEALRAAQEALDTVFMVRPDLFISQLATFDSSSLTLDGAFPIEARYRRAVEDYIIFRCELKDDEAVETGRSEATYKFFLDRLVS